MNWAEVQSRLALLELSRFLRKDVSGFEQAVPERLGDGVSLRGGRFIAIDRNITKREIDAGGKNPDDGARRPVPPHGAAGGPGAVGVGRGDGERARSRWRTTSGGAVGTDHGTSGPVFLAGPRVRAGVVGDAPRLTDLDANGNLKMGIDFRRVYATVLEDGLGLPARAALGGAFDRLPLFRDRSQ